MTRPFRLREAGIADVAVLAALHAKCFEDAWSPQSMLEVMGSPGVRAWIALVPAPRSIAPGGALPVAFAIARAVTDEAELLSIGVVDKHRRQGLATQLLAQVIDYVAARGVEKLFLEVAEDNPGAQALYLAHGFSRVGRRPDYYRGRDGSATAALTLRRHIVPTRWRWSKRS
jgi:ribosomal protein S18 acetylase RimI-like enzyme